MTKDLSNICFKMLRAVKLYRKARVSEVSGRKAQTGEVLTM